MTDVLPSQAERNRRPFRRWSTWWPPIAAAVAVMAAMCAIYLSGFLNSATHISGFPLAVVSEDVGTTTAGGSTGNAGEQIAAGLVSGMNGHQFTVRRLTSEQAKAAMNNGTLYGYVLIPDTFSADLATFSHSALTSRTLTRPTIHVFTNTRAGSGAATIAGNALNAALTQVSASTGKQLTAQLTAAATAQGGQLTGIATSVLADPLSVVTAPFDPLPAGTGSGLSAFYWALLLVLAGFTGTMAISTLVDTRLGFIPKEIGPLYRLNHNAGVSRRATLVAKWPMAAIAAPLIAPAYLGIAHWVGMPIDRPWQLWGFSTLMIVGVATTAATMQAVAGNVGLFVNMFFFMILATPSAGGTIPLEASPQFFRWLASFEPMRQIYIGSRSILYFDGSWHTGLGHAILAAMVATVAAVVVGLVGSSLYDRHGLHRGHYIAPRHTHVAPSGTSTATPTGSSHAVAQV